MRNLHELDGYRVEVLLYGGSGDSTNGCFEIPKGSATLCVIASSGLGWDHVSVSLPNRCPNWPEMDYIKRLFFKDEETVMQLHVPPSANISFHQYCLHLWRPQNQEIPRPPDYMVGPKT